MRKYIKLRKIYENISIKNKKKINKEQKDLIRQQFAFQKYMQNSLKQMYTKNSGNTFNSI